MKVNRLIPYVILLSLICGCSREIFGNKATAGERQAKEGIVQYSIADNSIGKEGESIAIILGEEQLYTIDLVKEEIHFLQRTLLYSMNSIAYSNNNIYYQKGFKGSVIDGLYCNTLNSLWSKKIIRDHIDRYLVTEEGVVYSIYGHVKSGKTAGIYFYRFSDKTIIPLVQGIDGEFGQFVVCRDKLIYFDFKERQLRQIDLTASTHIEILCYISSDWITNITVLDNGDIIYVDRSKQNELVLWKHITGELITIKEHFTSSFIVNADKMYFDENQQVFCYDLKSNYAYSCFTIPSIDGMLLKRHAYFKDCIVFDFCKRNCESDDGRFLQHKVFIYSYEGDILHTF